MVESSVFVDVIQYNKQKVSQFAPKKNTRNPSNNIHLNVILHGPHFFLLYQNSCNSSPHKPNLNLIIFNYKIMAGELCMPEGPHYVTKNLPVLRRPKRIP